MKTYMLAATHGRAIAMRYAAIDRLQVSIPNGDAERLLVIERYKRGWRLVISGRAVRPEDRAYMRAALRPAGGYGAAGYLV